MNKFRIEAFVPVAQLGYVMEHLISQGVAIAACDLIPMAKPQAKPAAEPKQLAASKPQKKRRPLTKDEYAARFAKADAQLRAEIEAAPFGTEIKIGPIKRKVMKDAGVTDGTFWRILQLLQAEGVVASTNKGRGWYIKSAQSQAA